MEFYEFIKIINLFLISFFSIFLFTNKEGKLLQVRLLALIFSFQALELLNATFYRYFDYWATQFPWIFYTTEFSFFLWGPTIYFFYKTATIPNTQIRKQDLYHLIPATIHIIYLTVRFHIYSNPVKTEMLTNGVMSAGEDFVIHLCRNISISIYLIYSFLLLKQNKISFTQKYRWLIFFFAVFAIVELIQVLHFADLLHRNFNKIIYNTTTLFWFTVAVTTLFKALQNPLFFIQNEAELQIGNKGIATTKQDAKATNDQQQQVLTTEELEQLINRLTSVMFDKEIYIDPELNLSKLAHAIESNAHKTSFAINEHFKQNFSDYINSHRIEKAKVMLASQSQSDKTILEIAYEVGFNSKATFNRAFTKFTSVSPSQYRKNHSPQ